MKQRRLNGWRRLALTPLLLLTVLLLVLTASLMRPGITHAQSGNSFTIASTAQLIARTTVQISVTAPCTLPVGATNIEEDGNLTISQASGREIVQASTFFTPLCDGTAHTFQLNATPPAGSAPFHGGPAIAQGGFQVFFTDASGNNGFVEASAGPQTIHING